MKIALILTAWKRNNLELQIKQILKQTLRPNYVVVFQNENHINIDNIVKKYNCIHVKVHIILNILVDFHICLIYQLIYVL